MCVACGINRSIRSLKPTNDERVRRRRTQGPCPQVISLGLLLLLSITTDAVLAASSDISASGAASQEERAPEPLNISANVGVAYDNNVSRARDSIDKLSDEFL